MGAERTGLPGALLVVHVLIVTGCGGSSGGTQPATTDVTGTWSGTVAFTLPAPRGRITSPFSYLLTQTGSTVAGSQTTGDTSPISSQSTLNGSSLSIVHFPVVAQNGSDDCHLFSNTFTYAVSGGMMTLSSISGSFCFPNGLGGHILETATDPSGTLTRQ
jgi:hypothetical protein